MDVVWVLVLVVVGVFVCFSVWWGGLIEMRCVRVVGGVNGVCGFFFLCW